MDCSEDSEIPEILAPEIRREAGTGVTWVQTPFTVEFVKQRCKDGAVWQQELQQNLSKPSALRRFATEPASFPRELSIASSQESTYSADPADNLTRIMRDKERKRRMIREMHDNGQGFGIPFVLLGRHLLITRYRNELFVTSSVCPHQQGNLAEGEIADIEDFSGELDNADNEQRRILLICPRHNWKFCLRTGVNIGSEKDPTRSLQRYHVKTDTVETTNGIQKYFFISGHQLGCPDEDHDMVPANVRVKQRKLLRRQTAV